MEGMNSDKRSTGDEHYDGAAFAYVVVAFLACILVPWTLSIIRKWRAGDATRYGVECRCQGCVAKEEQIREKKKNPTRATFVKWAVFGSLWLLLLVALFSAVTAEVEQGTAQFDPFKVLEIPTDADNKLVKRTCRKMAAKWHPDQNRDDRETAEAMFIAVQRACKTLTDDTAKENWIKYGNPDGPQGFNVGIALPAWLVDQNNSVLVLLVYVALVMIVLPAALIQLWFKWRELAPNEVMYKTMSVYGHFLQIGMKVEHMIEVFCASSEFSEINVRKSDATSINELMVGMSKKAKSEKPPKDGTYRPEFREAGYVIKCNILVYAHLNRMHDQLTPALREDLNKILRNGPHLVNGMLSIIQGRARGPAPLNLILMATKLSQMMVQGCWPHQELLQLPYMDQLWMKEFASKKYRNDKGLIRNFAQMGKDARRKVFLGDEKTRNRKDHIFMTTDQVNDIENVLSFIPLHIAVEAEVRVDDEVGFISPDAIVSVFVRCHRVESAAEVKAQTKVKSADADNVKALIAAGATLKGSAARVAKAAVQKAMSGKQSKGGKQEDDSIDLTNMEVSSDDDEEDDDEAWHPVEDESEKFVETHEVEAHSPKIPQHHVERHWVILADPARQLMWGVKKTGISPKGFENETLKLMFQAPQRPGKYCWAVYVISDSYLGCETKVDVNFVVHPAPEFAPVVDDVFSDEEISLSDSDDEGDADDDFEDK